MGELALGAAFIAGISGSAHCVAMCGGLAAAFGARQGHGLANTLLYQAGRILSYAIAGALAGALVSAVGLSVRTPAWAAALRIATSIAIILIGIKISLGSARRFSWLVFPERWGGGIWRRIVPWVRALTPQQPALRALVLGMLWGWLPCGLVYSALVMAALSGGAAGGAAIMIAFGLGTLPALLGVTVAGSRLFPRQAQPLRLLGACIIACGLWAAAVPISALVAGPHAGCGHEPATIANAR